MKEPAAPEGVAELLSGDRREQTRMSRDRFGRRDEGPMIAEVYQRLADRCRKLLSRARTAPAKEQILLWLAEFEARAAEAELEESRNREGDDTC